MPSLFGQCRDCWRTDLLWLPGGGLVAQPARLNASSSGISLCLGELFLCMVSYLVDFSLPALFLFPGFLLGLGPGSSEPGSLFIPPRLPGLALSLLPISMTGPVESHSTTGQSGDHQ
ncbi:hypothetical protein AHA_2051 [Aeromonas hydrophila subsp. hydrophila ATCC 7966]|uniref:Uncharacterized protein n=1 Tax=Aeromonas hydrophila subsp. hydrophila (strain ATCC 7966 / DSM 30187 / BCRC 13018 / CCUG 14551 / JCM 1027 / KCTC 2358 / NCIMB 9240 / NCTC 8049) TaxID=380703 RepID=A0KJY1_AERHH|nr:hypothetical protein AHA_2051 [Aeromonas hydrophila subsp. hydrophila ATCC 7966]